MNLKCSSIIVIMVIFTLSLTAFAQDVTSEGDDIDSFATGAVITGTVDALGEGSVTIDGVIYWLSAEVDASIFVVGEGVTITTVVSQDAIISIISAESYNGELEDIDPNDNHPVGHALADGLGVEYEVIMEWADAQIGFGEIARAYLIANYAGIEVEEVFAQRIDLGMGWGAIMKQYDVTPSEFAPGRLISGKLIIAPLELPDDVEADGTLTAEWAPDVTSDSSGDTSDDSEGDENEASNQGNDGINKFGCDGRGNSCNAPGQVKKNSDSDTDGE